MGLFKRRYEKNVTRDNEFMKSYATKVHSLLMYTEGNEKITKELRAMMDDLQYTVASSSSDAKSFEKKIKKDFDALTQKLQSDSWDEAEALSLIRNIRRYTVEIGSIR